MAETVTGKLTGGTAEFNGQKFDFTEAEIKEVRICELCPALLSAKEELRYVKIMLSRMMESIDAFEKRDQ